MIQKNRIINIILIFFAVFIFIAAFISLINYMTLKKDIIDVALFFNESIEYDKMQMENIIMFNLRLYTIFFIINILYVMFSCITKDKLKKIHSIITKMLFVIVSVLFLFWLIFDLFLPFETFEFNKFYHLIYFNTLIYFFAYICIYSFLQIFILFLSNKKEK